MRVRERSRAQLLVGEMEEENAWTTGSDLVDRPPQIQVDLAVLSWAEKDGTDIYHYVHMDVNNLTSHMQVDQVISFSLT